MFLFRSEEDLARSVLYKQELCERSKKDPEAKRWLPIPKFKICSQVYVRSCGGPGSEYYKAEVTGFIYRGQVWAYEVRPAEVVSKCDEGKRIVSEPELLQNRKWVVKDKIDRARERMRQATTDHIRFMERSETELQKLYDELKECEKNENADCC